MTESGEGDKKKIQLQPKSVPFFADEVLVQSGIKYNPDKKARFKKTGIIRLGFLDMRTRSVISDIVMSPITAENLHRILGEHVARLDRKMKAKGMPKMPEKPTATPTGTQSYIG
jgi:hypothetical protein